MVDTQLTNPFYVISQYQIKKDGKKSWLSDERVQILTDVGFEWNMANSKSKKKAAKKRKKAGKKDDSS